MTANPILHFLNLFRRTALLHESQEQSDAQLLDRFVRGDGVALETLVRRHAAMVWGVCRRNLTHHDDAEDAFQATFLVLLRKAASLRSRELLAKWLYGVAYKTACKARQTAAKRRAREKQVETMPEPPAETPDDTFGAELLGHLDRELNGLPEKYRTAVVLCELQGRTIRDVAQELRVPDGTVASRLARGREMLAQRMSRHGAGVSAGAVAAVCSQQAASGAVPTALLTRTVEAVRLMAAGQPVTAGLLRAEVSPLTESVLRAMAWAKRKVVSAVFLLAGLAIGGGMMTYQIVANPPNRLDQQAGLTSPTPKGNQPDPIPKGDPDPGPRDVEARFGKEQDALKFGKGGLLTAVGRQQNMNSRALEFQLRDVKANLNLETGHWTVKGLISISDGTQTRWRGYLLANMRAIEWEADVSYTPIGRLWEWHTVRMDYAGPNYGPLSAAACFTNAKSIIKPPIDRNLQDVPAIYLSGTMVENGKRIGSGTKVTDEDLKRIGGLKRLRILDLSDTDVTDAGLKHLENFPTLHALNLHGCRRVTGTALKWLKGLRSVNLSASGVTDAGLAHLEGCESLQWLDLSSTQVTDEGLKNIKNLPCLQTLILASCDSVTGAGLKGVKSLNSLNLSRLSPGGVTDANLEGLKDLHGLETLDLSGTQVGDEGLNHLRGLRSLQRLFLMQTAVTDAGMECLLNLQNLQALEVTRTRVTENGLKRIKKAFPKCKLLNLSEDGDYLLRIP